MILAQISGTGGGVIGDGAPVGDPTNVGGAFCQYDIE